MFECVQNIQNVFNLESVGSFWSHDASDPNVITMSSPGKGSLVPSDWNSADGAPGDRLSLRQKSMKLMLTLIWSGDAGSLRPAESGYRVSKHMQHS